MAFDVRVPLGTHALKRYRPLPASLASGTMASTTGYHFLRLVGTSGGPLGPLDPTGTRPDGRSFLLTVIVAVGIIAMLCVWIRSRD